VHNFCTLTSDSPGNSQRDDYIDNEKDKNQDSDRDFKSYAADFLNSAFNLFPKEGGKLVEYNRQYYKKIIN